MDFLFSLLFSNPYALPVLGIVGALFLYNRYASQMTVRVPGGGFSVEDLVGKVLGPRYQQAKFDRAVQKLTSQGNILGAGKMLEDAERFTEAANLYVEGNEFYAAAAAFERLGKLERAAELYLQAGEWKKAAQLFVTAGKPARAAVLFQEKGNNLEAARFYGLSGSWAMAGELYEKSGYPARAAEAYEKTGEFARAAEAYERHFMENVSYAASYSANPASGDQKSALLSGRLFEKAGDLNRAFQVYSKGSYFKEAAVVCLATHQPAKAAELYMRAEDPDSAATAYEQAGDIVKAANLRGEIALKSDRIPEAAAFFQQGEDYLRAAELFESVGLLAEAAGAYEAGDSYAAAGSVYVRAGLKDRAAASYERAGDFETAAKFYEEAGNGRKAAELFDRAGLTFRSGEAALKAGDRDKAIALLQRVPSTDENYRAASEHLAHLFVDAGMPGLAVERLQKILSGQPVSSNNLDLYYVLAVAAEAMGKVPEALGLYKKILAEDFKFRDVDKRIARLQAAGGAGAARPAAAAASSSTHGRRAGDSGPAPAPSPARAAPTPAPPAAPAAPVKKARFAKKEEIGSGPLGPVFRGEDQVDGRSVALRVLSRPALGSLVGTLPELVTDLKAAAQLSHPNLVKVLGLVEIEGERCVITELVQGRHLGEAIKAGHRMTFQQAHGLGRVLAQALAFVHGKGLVHGSLQPSNVFVVAGVVKVADLGLGRVAQGMNSLDGYAPPQRKLDVAGDLYALGGVLYHLLTGTHPRTQPQGSALPLPSKMAPGVPEAFDKLLLRCLHPREEVRYASAEDILAQLKDMVRIG